MQQNPPKNKPKRGCGRILLVFIVLILAAAGIAAFVANNWYQTNVYDVVGDESTSAKIVVEKGQTLFDIAPTLVEENILSNVDALRVYLRLEEPEIVLQAGNYEISGGKNIPQLIARLNAGPKIVSVNVTIQEGLRYDQVANKLETAFKEAEITNFDKSAYTNMVENPANISFETDVQAFLDSHLPAGKNLEGFLFPDAYTLGTDATTQQILELQIRTFMRRVEENNIDIESPGRADTFYNAIILASIVEREAGPKPEMPIVADIFLKRYEENSLLGADATLLYTFKDWSHALTISELEDTSNPYNTRALAGLPPTPISNPGLNALAAIFDPADTSYYYFITSAVDGKNYYAETFTQHQQNIANHL